jgi:hypothetical protein
MLDEGLDWARRRADWMRTSWITANYGELLWYLGRLPEAHAMAVEAVAASVRVGDAELIASRTVCLAVMGLVMGDREEADRLLTQDVRRMTQAESQTRAFLMAVDAWLAWPDASRVDGRLEAALASPGPLPNGEVAGLALARVALRAGRDDLVAAAAELTRRAVEGRGTGPRMRLLGDVAAALCEPARVAWPRLETIGAKLAEAGYRYLAAEAEADAALLASRAGADGLELAHRARRRYEESSVVPVLGDPVEAVELVAAGRR